MQIRDERRSREKAGGGIDRTRRLTEIELASKRAHERTVAEREGRRDRPEAPVGQAGARKGRPMYSISDPPGVE